jgi:hypothetical protein
MAIGRMKRVLVSLPRVTMAMTCGPIACAGRPGSAGAVQTARVHAVVAVANQSEPGGTGPQAMLVGVPPMHLAKDRMASSRPQTCTLLTPPKRGKWRRRRDP